MIKNVQDSLVGSENCSLEITIKIEDFFFKMNKQCKLEIDFCENSFIIDLKRAEDVENLFFHIPKVLVEQNKQIIFNIILKRSDKSYKFFEIIELDKDHLLNNYAVLEIRVEDEKIMLKADINQEKFIQFIEQIGSKSQIKKSKRKYNKEKKKPRKRKNTAYISSTDGPKDETINTDSTIFNIQLDEKSLEQAIDKRDEFDIKKNQVDNIIELDLEQSKKSITDEFRRNDQHCEENKRTQLVNENLFSQSELEESKNNVYTGNLEVDINTLSDVSEMFFKTTQVKKAENQKQDVPLRTEVNINVLINLIKEMNLNIKDLQNKHHDLEKAFKTENAVLNEKINKLQAENESLKKKIDLNNQENMEIKGDIILLRNLRIIKNFLNQIRSHDRRYELLSYAELTTLIFDFKIEEPVSSEKSYPNMIVFRNKDFEGVHDVFYEYLRQNESNLTMNKIIKSLEFGKNSYQFISRFFQNGSLSPDFNKEQMEEIFFFDLLNYYITKIMF